MQITLTLSPCEEEDVDAEDDTGLTEDAYGRLSDAIMGAGFDFVAGPDKVA